MVLKNMALTNMVKRNIVSKKGLNFDEILNSILRGLTVNLVFATAFSRKVPSGLIKNGNRKSQPFRCNTEMKKGFYSYTNFSPGFLFPNNKKQFDDKRTPFI